jgi:tetratricopeptide (TPR) repeat protein
MKLISRLLTEPYWSFSSPPKICKLSVERQWAMTQNNLGSAYSDRIIGDRAENIERAIAAYNLALTVRTPEALPLDYANTSYNLGLTYEKAQRFQDAFNSYKAAIDAVEDLRDEIVSGDDSKQKLAEEWNKLYLNMVKVCLILGKDTEAIEYAELSKTRNLVELIFSRDFKTIFPPEIAAQLEQLRDEIASGQYQLQTKKAENPTELAQRLTQLRQQSKKNVMKF